MTHLPGCRRHQVRGSDMSRTCLVTGATGFVGVR